MIPREPDTLLAQVETKRMALDFATPIAAAAPLGCPMSHAVLLA